MDKQLEKMIREQSILKKKGFVCLVIKNHLQSYNAAKIKKLQVKTTKLKKVYFCAPKNYK